MTALPTQEAYAQEVEAESGPYRVDIVSIAKDRNQTKKVIAQISEELDAREDVQLDRGALRTAAKENGLRRSSLSNSDGRAENQDLVATVLEQANLEAVVLVDVVSKGKKIQIVILGPDGGPIHESVNKLRKKRQLSSKETSSYVGAALDEAGPMIDARREEIAIAERERLEEERRRKEAEERRRREEEENSDFSDLTDPDKDEDRADGPLPTKFKVGAGVFVGRRSFNLINDFIEIGQQTPLLGAGAHLRYGHGLSGDKLNVGIQANFAWAPFKNQYTNTAGEQQSLASNFVQGGARARLMYAVADIFALGAHVGADVLSVTIDPNPTYTGHRYIWARAGADIALMLGSGLTIEAGASALPVLQAVTSGGAYGDGESTVALGAHGALIFPLTKDLTLDASYSYTGIDLTYTKPEGQNNVPTTQDTMHTGVLSVNYAF